MQELKDELATKFVVGLGRVREIFVVYWRELEEMRKCEGRQSVRGREDYGYEGVSVDIEKKVGYGETVCG